MSDSLKKRVMQRLYGEDIWASFLEGKEPNAEVSTKVSQTKPKTVVELDGQIQLREIAKEAAADNIQGWNGTHGLLVRLAAQPVEKLVVDVGVWKGQSSVTLAKAIRGSGFDGCVISIDTFLGSTEHWWGQADNLFQRPMGRPDLYEQFMENVWRAGVSDLVIPLPQTSLAAASILKQAGIKAAIVHIDAAHDYDSVQRDIAAYWDLVQPGGFLVGDDYANEWPGVVQAVDEFVAAKTLKLQLHSPKWVVKKPQPGS